MLLTVTPNPCVERTALIPDFAAGAVHRVTPDCLMVNAGGKGINAARVAIAMGMEARALAWVGFRQHQWFDEQLDAEGVPHDLVEVQPDTRVSYNIVDGRGGKTEVVEAGSHLTQDDGDRLLRKFEYLLAAADLVALCGSYPPTPQGVSEDHLLAMCRAAEAAGKPVLVDSKGPAFRALLEAGFRPWCIKPNLEEAADVLDRPITDEQGEREALRDLMDLGLDVVFLSCGPRGFYLGLAATSANLGGTWFIEAPSVSEISSVGSGDALVGAFLAMQGAGVGILEAARWGAAAGAANAAMSQSGFCTRLQVAALLPRVTVRALS